MVISSKSNEKVKFLKNLNDKKFRKINKAYYLEGLKVTYEVLKKEKVDNILFIAYSSNLIQKINDENNYFRKILDFCNKNKIEILEFENNLIEYVTDTVTPQGIICVLRKNEKKLEEEIKLNKDKDLFILDSVQDMGNLGTIIRNAAAFNIKNIICLDGTADIFSPKVLRATMGTIFDVNVFYLNFDEVYDFLKNNGYKIIGTSLNSSENFEKLKFDEKYAFVLGNEANGVSLNILKKCDKLIKIDMENNIDSLNVSVASGIIGYTSYLKRKKLEV